MKGLITAVVLVGTLLVFVLTNPGLDDYDNFLRRQMTEEARGEDEIPRALAAILGGFAGTLLGQVTTRDNYVIFSIYKTELDADELVVLGILGNFVVLSDGKE